MTTIIITALISAIIASIITYFAVEKRIRDRYETLYNMKVFDLKGRPTRSISDRDCFRLLQNIETFVEHQYDTTYLLHHEWVEKAKHDGDWAILAFLRWVHGAGCRVVIEEIGCKDIESNPDKADEVIKYRYKAHYNHTFEQITGRSWMDSDY